MIHTKSLLLFICLVLSSPFYSNTITDQINIKISELNALISDLKTQDIDTYKEELAVRTSEVFMQFADWDEANVTANTSYFNLYSTYKNDAAQMASDLADFERNDIIKLLDENIAYALLLKEGKVFRTPTPRIEWSQVSHDEDQLTFAGRPVFLADYTWKPDNDALTEFYGNQDGFYLDNSLLQDDKGTITSWTKSQLENKEDGRAGFIFIGNTSVPQWAKDKYGDEFTSAIGDPFYMYDVDHPGAKEMNGLLLDATVPYMSGKKYTELGYMLCNEPRWITYKDGTNKVWYTSGVSEYTMVKFRLWLKEKYIDINALDNNWKAYYTSFDQVNIDVPVDISKRGSAMWYDWNTFNDARVVEWFTWMKDRVRQNDPLAKVHLKIMPSFFTDNDPATGIDLEALTELSDINGNDCAAHYNNTSANKADWEAKYILGWRELYLGYDFLKSVAPHQINYNSESHLLSTGHTRDLYMNPKYVRAAYWAATLLGMDASQTWYWPREADGSIARAMTNAYAGSNNQQPRVTNELHATLADLNTFSEDVMAFQRQRKALRVFYSKTSACQRGNYMDDVFAMYESLNFSGISLGFATKNIISKQDKSNWDAVLVYKTERVTQAERDTLQMYLDNGGIVIMDKESLLVDEYGALLAPLSESLGTLIKVASLSEVKSKALDLLATKSEMPKVSVTESNSTAYKGCVWRCVTRANGEQVLSISNYGKTEAKINISLNGATQGTRCMDLIHGVQVPSQTILQPYDVLFVEVSDGEDVLSSLDDASTVMHAVLYPTVCDNSFCLEFGAFVEELDVAIFSSEGKLLSQKSYADVDFIQEHVSHLDSGNYFVRVHDGKSSQSFRFVKKS